MANSPTTVLPAPVGAQTRTPEPSSSASHASTWNGSRENPRSAVKSASAGWAVRRRAAAYRSAGLDMLPTVRTFAESGRDAGCLPLGLGGVQLGDDPLDLADRLGLVVSEGRQVGPQRMPGRLQLGVCEVDHVHARTVGR